jgi:hypothetical protein
MALLSSDGLAAPRSSRARSANRTRGFFKFRICVRELSFNRLGNPLFPVRPSHDGSSRNGSYRLSSIGQQRQPLFAIHGLPGDKLLGKHIHPTKKSQLDEKLQKI